MYARIGILFLAVALSSCCATGQKHEGEKKPPGEPPSEESILQMLQRDSELNQAVTTPKEEVQVIDAIYQDLLFAAKESERFESDSIGRAILAFPVGHPDVGAAKIRALHRFRDIPGALDTVLSAVGSSEPKIQKEAAETLIHWGEEWDLAIPVIRTYGMYDILGYCGDPRAVEVLQEGARSSTWEGRINAAFVLQSFGDSTTIADVARDVVANAPLTDDDNSTARAKYTALNALARQHAFDQVPNIARMAADTALLVRIQAVDVLAFFARTGSPEARAGLLDISVSSPDLNLRETAKEALQRLDIREEEK